MPYSLVYVTCRDAEEAARIGRALVEERLAASVNVLPGLRSFYRWKGAVHDEPEAAIIIKTSDRCVEKLIQKVKSMHGYDLPCVVALPVRAGLPDYLAWVDRETATA